MSSRHFNSSLRQSAQDASQHTKQKPIERRQSNIHSTTWTHEKILRKSPEETGIQAAESKATENNAEDLSNLEGYYALSRDKGPMVCNGVPWSQEPTAHQEICDSRICALQGSK